MPEYTDQEKVRFRQELDARRAAGRRIDPVLRCVACGYSCAESQARQLGLTACPSCGSKQVAVTALDYNPQVPNNPLPTPQEAERQSRAQRPWIR